MVLEQLFKVEWIERKWHAFFIGFIYSVVGFLSAYLIFPSSVGIMSIAFISILMIPSLAMLLQIEENVEIRENKFSLIQLFKDHADIFKVYISMFIGVFMAYSSITIILLDTVSLNLFPAQLAVAGITGRAFNSGIFSSIVMNNLLIFAVCLILSFAYGAGAILFLVWNASVWGVVIPYMLLMSAGDTASFTASFVAVMPHLITEAVAYISAAIAGGVLSKAVLREKPFSKGFNHIMTDSLIIVVIGIVLVAIAALVEVAIMV